MNYFIIGAIIVCVIIVIKEHSAYNAKQRKKANALNMFADALARIKEHPEQASEILQGVADDDLDSAVYSLVDDKAYDYWDVTKLMALTKGQRMVFCTRRLESLLADRNCGFNQFFYSYSQLVYETLEGYRLIGANEYANVVDSAISTVMRERPEWLEYNGSSDTLESWKKSVDWRPISNLYGLDFDAIGIDENPVQLRAKYIREHPEEFVNG